MGKVILASGSAGFDAAVLKQIALLAHPVGSYYWSSEKTSPSELFGGEWEPVEDKFVYAAKASDAKAGVEGGAATVALSVAQMPSHTHAGPSHTHSVKAHSHGLAGHTHTIPNHVHHIGPHSHKLGAYRADKEPGTDGSTYGLWSVGNGFNGRPLVAISSYGLPNDADTSLSGEGDLASNGGGGATSAPNVTNTADSVAFDTSASGTGATGAAGSGAAHNNMPPYVTAYCWRRTA